MVFTVVVVLLAAAILAYLFVPRRQADLERLHTIQDSRRARRARTRCAYCAAKADEHTTHDTPASRP